MAATKKASLKKDEIYASVLNDIVEGVYKQNQIITEKQLIEKYGVSKSPIRDALIELCNEGVLLSHPRYGYEVVRINEADIRSIIQFRVIVETACFREAARIMTQKQIEDLRSWVKEKYAGQREDTALNHWKNNIEFHLRLVSCSGNPICYKEIEKMIGILTRAYAQWNWEKTGAKILRMGSESHVRIVELFSQGKIDEAEEELRRDIVSYMNMFD